MGKKKENAEAIREPWVILFAKRRMQEELSRLQTKKMRKVKMKP